MTCAACAPASMPSPAETPTSETQATEEPTIEVPPPLTEATPTLSIPTPGAAIIETWTGVPNYPESLPGMLYRLEYDSNRWIPTEDQFGQTVLAHRFIEVCVLSPAVGRGLPPNYNAESSFRSIGELQYEVVTISENRIPRYINYFGGDGVIFTGFQLSFQGYTEACIQEAEAILATLVSVPENP